MRGTACEAVDVELGLAFASAHCTGCARSTRYCFNAMLSAPQVPVRCEFGVFEVAHPGRACSSVHECDPPRASAAARGTRARTPIGLLLHGAAWSAAVRPDSVVTTALSSAFSFLPKL